MGTNVSVLINTTLFSIDGTKREIQMTRTQFMQHNYSYEWFLNRIFKNMKMKSPSYFYDLTFLSKCIEIKGGYYPDTYDASVVLKQDSSIYIIKIKGLVKDNDVYYIGTSLETLKHAIDKISDMYEIIGDFYNDGEKIDKNTMLMKFCKPSNMTGNKQEPTTLLYKLS